MIESHPKVTFYQLWPSASGPSPADVSVLGSVPLRAFQHCEPFRAANAFGWYLYPPIDFEIRWDGRVSYWRRNGNGRMERLRIVPAAEITKAVQTHKGQEDAKLHGLPSFLSHAPEPGVVQIWSGVVARTPAQWGLLVRPLVNYPRDPAYDVLEGIIESDWWVGPLLSVVRIVQTNVTIEFRRNRPYAHIQLVHRSAYSRETVNAAVNQNGIVDMPVEMWDKFRSFLQNASKLDRVPGTYKRAAGLQRNCAKENPPAPKQNEM
jgi:hypothetical protein